MANWLEYSIDERKALLANVATAKQIEESAVEKDWWVTTVLHALFTSSIAPFLLFKGGTSLSKGWDLIGRFSEDIDLAIDRRYFLEQKQWECAACNNNNQIKNLRIKSQDFFYQDFRNELFQILTNFKLSGIEILTEIEERIRIGNTEPVPHDADPSVLYVHYPSLFNDPKPYALPVVKIEISCLSMDEPFEIKSIESLVQQINAPKYGIEIDNDYSTQIRTITPVRTFLEKAFLLNEEYQKPKEKGGPRTHRMSRHLYDILMLSQAGYKQQALSNPSLYAKIVEHRRKYYHVGYVNYDSDYPKQIQFYPPEHLIAEYRKDYQEMRTSFIYDKKAPEFSQLLEDLNSIQQEFRALN